MKKQQIKKGHKLHKAKIIRKVCIAVILVLLLVVAALLVYLYIIRPNRSFSGYEVTSKIDREDAEATTYLQYGSKIIKYNRNGVSVIDGLGTIHWTASYEMQNPIVAFAGDFIAVGDAGNKQLYVFNAKGSPAKIDILSPVIKLSLSEQGEVAVLMQKKDTYHIQIYDPYAPSKQLKAEIETYIVKDGYALDIGISKDGAKLVTSYFYLEGNTLSTNITFYSFTGVGQTYEDRIVGAFPYKDQLFSDVQFLTNNTVCIFGEKTLAVYSMKQKPELIFSQQYEQDILQVFSNKEYTGVVLEGGEEDSRTQVFTYNLNGKEVFNKKLDFAPEGASVEAGNFLFYTSDACAVYRSNGQLKYKGSLKKEARYMMHGKHDDRFIIITDTSIDEITLSKNEG